LSTGEIVSQEVSAPFCILQSQFVRERGSPWLLIAILMIAGAPIFCFGVWDLVQTFPDYRPPAMLILIGGVLLLLARVVLRTVRRDHRYWLGVDRDKLTLMQEGIVVSWAWTEIGPFRVSETVSSGFEVKSKGRGLNDEVNFKQHPIITLSAPALDGPPIWVPFDRFMDVGHSERDRADNFCIFLNDMRQRGRSGGLAHGDPPFLAPIELNIVPMRNGVPAAANAMSPVATKPAVQRE